MRSKTSARTDTAFEAFRQEQRAETARLRRAAVDQLLAFAAGSPRAFDDREWARAVQFLERLHALAWRGARVLPPDRIAPPPRVSRARIRAVHAELHRALAEIFPTNPSDRWELRIWHPPMHARLPVLVSEHGHVGQAFEAGWPDTVWVSVMSLLEEFGRGIHRCGVCPERRLFLKSKRQQYCSRHCSQRVRSARWYRAHREVALERRHVAYVRRAAERPKRVRQT